jgi:hypothetical protein
MTRSGLLKYYNIHKSGFTADTIGTVSGQRDKKIWVVVFVVFRKSTLSSDPFGSNKYLITNVVFLEVRIVTQ